MQPPYAGIKLFRSLSAWREWIEINRPVQNQSPRPSLSPHGESGLKYPQNAVVSVSTCLSPHGESGLKFSPTDGVLLTGKVSLRMERVD